MKRVGLIFGSRSVEHEISITTASKAYEALRQLRGEYETRPDLSDQGRRLAHRPGRGAAPDDRGRGPRLPGARPPQDAPGELQGAAPRPGAGRRRRGPAVPAARSDGARTLPETRSGPRGSRRRWDRSWTSPFPIVHGTHGEDGTLQGLFELADIPYVGTGRRRVGGGDGQDPLQAALPRGGPAHRGGDLVQPTSVARRRGRRHPRGRSRASATRWWSSRRWRAPASGSPGRPNAQELVRAVAQAIQFSARVLVEKALDDRLEIQCAVLGNHDPVVSECEELTQSAGIVSFEDKYLRRPGAAEADLAPSHIPARIPDGPGAARQGAGPGHLPRRWTRAGSPGWTSWWTGRRCSRS